MKKAARRKKKSEAVEVKATRPPIVAEIEPPVKEKKGVNKFFSNKPFMIGTVIILLIAISAGIIYGISYFAEDAQVSAETSTQEIERILKELEKLAVLPNETPTIATVSDVEQLKGQAFFNRAQNGDKVVIFGVAREAVLYRPSAKRIINMSTIDANNLAQSGESATNSATTEPNLTPTPKEKIKVAVFNSTQEVGLASRGGDLLDEESFEVVSLLNANGEYETTSISVINRDVVADNDIDAITKAYPNVTVESKALPSGEAAPAGADVVIILGTDFSEAY